MRFTDSELSARDYWHKVRPEYEARKAHNQFKRKGGR